jgi:predicted nucleic acid-binding protein
VRLLVDTGVFSASLSHRHSPSLDRHVTAPLGNQLFIASATVAELGYGAIIAEWGAPQRERIETAITAATVVPVTDALLTAVAGLRAAYRRAGHRLADKVHGNDRWIAASAIHVSASLVTADGVFAETPGLVLFQ